MTTTHRIARIALTLIGLCALAAGCATAPAPSAPKGGDFFSLRGDERYQGDLVNGLRHGQGTYTWPDGRRFVGEFRNGLPNGRGTYTLPNGEEYVGEYVDNRRTGQGSYRWPDGRRYVGEFRDDLPNGQGTLTLASGERQVGEFRNGAYVDEVAARKLSYAGPGVETAARGGEARLRDKGGTFTVTGVVNNMLNVDFYLDSGSAHVSLPSWAFDELKRAGSIRQDDMLGFENYLMANGTTRKALTFRIRSLAVGSLVLENVKGSLADYNAPPLLGMSFLGRFQSWSVDNEKQILILK